MYLEKEVLDALKINYKPLVIKHSCLNKNGTECYDFPGITTFLASFCFLHFQKTKIGL